MSGKGEYFASKNLRANKFACAILPGTVGLGMGVCMNGIGKSTYREIRSSLGRFMAIFAIIALGVGLFAGLKVVRDAMVCTVTDYLNGHAFYDFRLLSTLGFEEGNVRAFAAQEDVEAAEGAVSMDVIYQTEDGGQGVLKAYSLPVELNTVELVGGRLPVKGDQCVVDSLIAGMFPVGSVIRLSQENEEDTLESFACREYTVVGAVQSPLYIQFERGSTSLGTGRVDGFFYLLPEGFETDYYTEVYVRFRQDNALYGSGYRDYIDGKRALFEELAETEARLRYSSVLETGEKELKEGREELAEKREEGEAELAEAYEELADARQKLTDGERELADAEQEITEGEETLEQKRRELADAKETLAKKEKELEQGEKEIEEGERALEENRQMLSAGKAQLKLGKIELTSAVAKLEVSSTELKTQSSNLEFAYRSNLISQEEYDAARGQIAYYQQQINAGWQALNDARRELDAAEQQIDEGEKELAEGERELKEAKRQLEAGRKAIRDGKREVAEGEPQLAEAEEELVRARETLEEKKAEFAEGKQELADGEREYEEGRLEFLEKIAEAEEELAEAEDKLKNLEFPDAYVLGRDTNVGYVCFENDSAIIDGIANVFPVFFFLVAAMVCITTMNRMVEEQRTQIGVLKALGYGNGAIMSKYMIYSGLAAALGCVAGFFMGTWGFPKVIWFAYGLMYRAAPIEYLFDWKLAAISVVVSLLCSMGATWLSCRAELFQVAAQLMRPKAPKAGKRVFLERIPLLWRHLSFLKKVSVRNIFRYKKRLFMMVLGISGCTALLVTGFGIRDSIESVADHQFQEIQIYDMSVSLKAGAEQTVEDRFEAIAGQELEGCLRVMETNMDLVAGTEVKSVYVVAGDAARMEEFWDMHTAAGSAIPYPGLGEGIITRKIAKQYGILPGDVVTLRNEDMSTLQITVAAVMENYIYNYVYIGQETWEQAFGEAPERRTLYVNLKEEADAHGISAALMELDGVVNVTVNADTMERVSTMLRSLDVIVIVVILCAGGLAFIVLYNLTNINITERVREIATVKVLGFYKRETASYVFRENTLLTAFGMLPGLLLGRFLHAFVMSQIQVDMIAFDVRVSPLSLLLSALLTFIFAWLVDRFMGKKLEEISMTESLKSVD